ncbi:MAG: EVE domain-containing protein [Hydrogenothermaceae bacterium]|nr:EVE domain-containing protein [Hydrogenothermaceae bacterium]
MAYFLFKTEPEKFSFEDLFREGKTVWNGVKNPLAQRFLRSTKIGDIIFIYHTGKERQIIGTGEVISEAYLYSDGYYVVDVKPVDRLEKSVKLRELKSLDIFGESPLLKIPRLSVVPISQEEAKVILSLSKSSFK